MSSDDIAISVRGLGKSYRIAQKSPHSTAIEALLHRFRNSVERTDSEEFWALRDISFDVKRGDIVGLVGRNGAGKSTLLKILSRVAEPTTGEIRITGRVASLIEVGTGFQPELTGRENIFLNGAILGMRRKEIARRFDEIVDFSGVEKFLDTPVKFYSSGMYVRLAFAVAAHLEADVLLIDEVLAVGDAQFQKKSLGKMEAVANSGRTVVFVSHDVTALEALCHTGLVFSAGQLVQQQVPIKEALSIYHRLSRTGGANEVGGRVDLGDSYHHFRAFDLIDGHGKSSRTVPIGGELRLRIDIQADDLVESPNIVVKFENSSGQRVLTVRSPRNEHAIERLSGRSEVTCTIASLPLAPGEYTVRIGLARGLEEFESVEQDIAFTVCNTDTFGDGWGANMGFTVASAVWQIASAANDSSSPLGSGCGQTGSSVSEGALIGVKPGIHAKGG